MNKQDPIERAERDAAANPLRISVQDIRQSLIDQGFVVPEHAGQKAEEIIKNLKRFVSAKYQWEVDYFLNKLEPSGTDTGESIRDFMGWHAGSFFGALVSLAIAEA